MRNRASLTMIELVLMFFVFSFAAAWCMRTFVWTDQQSQSQYQREKAMIQAQSAAEITKSLRGDLNAVSRELGGVAEGDRWVLYFDKDWELTDGEDSYSLQVTRADSGVPYLGRAVIEVRKGGQILAALEVGWQEVATDE